MHDVGLSLHLFSQNLPIFMKQYANSMHAFGMLLLRAGMNGNQNCRSALNWVCCDSSPSLHS